MASEWQVNSDVLTDLNSEIELPLVPIQVEIQLSSAGAEEEGGIEISGRGRRKRIARRIDDLNGCLCGTVVNSSADTSGIVKCRQPGCETQWVSYIDYIPVDITYMLSSITSSV